MPMEYEQGDNSAGFYKNGEWFVETGAPGLWSSYYDFDNQLEIRMFYVLHENMTFNATD